MPQLLTNLAEGFGYLLRCKRTSKSNRMRRRTKMNMSTSTMGKMGLLKQMLRERTMEMTMRSRRRKRRSAPARPYLLPSQHVLVCTGSKLLQLWPSRSNAAFLPGYAMCYRSKRKRKSAFGSKLSLELQEFLGETSMPRTEV